MTYAIVYSSRTGHTQLLADTVRETLPGDQCVYFGEPSEKALEADRLYVGFWTDKGSCDELTASFLKKVRDKELFLFGTAGFGVSQEYFNTVLGRVSACTDDSVRIIGSFMCQGKMPMSVRERYEKMASGPTRNPNLQGMIENFDKALSHPDGNDLDNLRAAVQ